MRATGMGCVLQIGLFLAGAWLLSRTLVKFGTRELRSPQTIFAGLILALQLPISLGVGFAIGGAEGIKAARDGIDPGIAQSRMKKKYWWLDLAVPGTAAALAGLVIVASLREPVFTPPPPDDPIGITDYRAVMAEQWETGRRADRDRARYALRSDDGASESRLQFDQEPSS